jgi:DNA polymerase
VIAALASDWGTWEATARDLLARVVPPDAIAWRDGEDGQQTLADLLDPQPSTPPARAPTWPVDFAARARVVACHRDGARWALLYRVLWRLRHGAPRLLEDAADPDAVALALFQRQVERDAYWIKAHVRFRRIDADEGPGWVAWLRPDHRSLTLAAPFFIRRFGGMRWAIATPDESVAWDGTALRVGPGSPRDGAPDADGAEALWVAYYRAIFNPARLKVKAMLAQMPLRMWDALPEAAIIPELIASAGERVGAMRAETPPSAHGFVPAGSDLAGLRAALPGCRGCDLCALGSRAVAGEGPGDAGIVLVGEQPGDEEDRAGRPFVGPAGRLLDRALAEAGIDRATLYVTNAVKHFRFDLRADGFRQHKTPSAKHVAACRPWLEAELAQLRPRLVVALGATAAFAVLGRQVAIRDMRGAIRTGAGGQRVLIAAHPASILRQPDAQRARTEYEELVRDLREAGAG